MKKGHHQYFTKKCESKQLNKVNVTIKKQFCVTSSPISEHLRGDVTTSPMTCLYRVRQPSKPG